MIQAKVDIFHVETVLDENLFPWYLAWVLKPDDQLAWWEKGLRAATMASLPLTPLFLRKWIFWSPLVWGPFGLLQVGGHGVRPAASRQPSRNVSCW